jgi:GTP-binding protein
MKFVDYVRIFVQSGHGGAGAIAFRRETNMPMGGPSGGDGGRGGDLIFVGDEGKSTLLDFHFQHQFAAKRGGHGKGKDQHGRDGLDCVIRVPPGTEVKDAETEEVLLEVVDESPQVLFRGGRGGKGNAHFQTSTRQAPRFAQPGMPGEERWVVLELKLIADVGLVGFPNAGKSTLISHISSARPKIADYPFTTLVPNLGVVHAENYQHFVVADIPGLIEGAHEGAGLGLQFLRHIERTALLVILLDPAELAEREPWEQYRVLLDELGRHSAALLEKPRLAAINKSDLFADHKALAPLRKKLERAGETVFVISSATGAGLTELVRELARRVAHSRKQLSRKDEARKEQALSAAPPEKAVLPRPRKRAAPRISESKPPTRDLPRRPAVAAKRAAKAR